MPAGGSDARVAVARPTTHAQADGSQGNAPNDGSQEDGSQDDGVSSDGSQACPAAPRIEVMRLLLDTHVFLWMHGSPERLGARARAALADARSELFLSVAVAWELGIKLRRKKLALPESLGEYVLSRAHASRMAILPIQLRHVIDAMALPLHHGDPFDRMLLAQARVEELTLVSADTCFEDYDVDLLKA